MIAALSLDSPSNPPSESSKESLLDDKKLHSFSPDTSVDGSDSEEDDELDVLHTNSLHWQLAK
jgi:hypothetical protein